MAVLTPSQIARLTFSSGALNDTHIIDLVFEELEKGDGLENVKQFYAELQAGETVGCFLTLMVKSVPQYCDRNWNNILNYIVC